MLKPPIRWGILGTSFISEVMANAIHESETSELIAVGSRALETAEAFSKKFSIPKYYGDYEALLHDGDIDVIYIGLPNHLHKEWIIRCAQAGKNILCEKPFVISEHEALEVISHLEQSKVFCMEALMYRCHPFTTKLEELIQSKIIGDVKLYSATYTANIAEIANPTSGGSIRNLGCYPISLVRLLANAEPVEQYGIGRVSQKNDTDNQASVVLKFEDDSIAMVSTADDLEMLWEFKVYGTKGYIDVISNPWFPDYNNKALIYLNNAIEPIEINVTAEKSLYVYQIDSVNRQLINKESSDRGVISLLDSLKNTIVLEAWRHQVITSKREKNTDIRAILV